MYVIRLTIHLCQHAAPPCAARRSKRSDAFEHCACQTTTPIFSDDNQINRRKNFTHQTSAKVVREHSLIATEKLAVKNMTASAKGTVEEPGKNIAQKAGLNREILDTSPASLIKAILYKAEEAGTAIHICATRKIKPSQRDPLSWKLVGKKTLAKRTHKLADGRTIGRDHAAALVMLRDALKTNGREPAWVGKTETPTVATA